MAKYHLTVYGKEQICPSCIGAPNSKGTFEWLQAAIKRKYDPNDFVYEYVDMDEEQLNKKHRKMIEQIEEEDMFYPLVIVNDEIVAEGIPNITQLFKAIDAL